MCHCPLILLRKQKLSDSNLQHINLVFRLLILGSPHYAHHDKVSKNSCSQQVLGYLTPSVSLFFKTCLPTAAVEEVG